MNIHTHISEAEQRRSAAATRARLMGKPAKPKPVAPILQITAGRKPVDASYHMVLYRKYQANLRATFSMASSFTINPVDDYCPYHSEIVFQLDDIPERRRSMKDIATEVLKDFPGVSLAEILGQKRTRSFIYPRHLAMYRIWAERRDLSFPMIGKFFNRDHTVILWAVSKIKAQMGDVESIARLERKKERNDQYKLNERSSA